MAIEIKISTRWMKPVRSIGRRTWRWAHGMRPAILAAIIITVWGCTMTPKSPGRGGLSEAFPPGTIISASLNAPVTQAALIDALASASAVYVGETHTDPAHHQVQLTVIESLIARGRPLSIGMEMFDRSYQEVLDNWSAGGLDWDQFLQATHWYANWRYPDALYTDILAVAKAQHIPVVGLNIPFHIPSKISIGGIESLNQQDRAWLPETIDTTDAAHRAYVQKVFDSHRIPGRSNFEHFYTAQCVWEDVMAESVARHASADKTMVVIIGNGHIVNKYGVPARAHRLSGLHYLTVIPVTAGQEIDLSEGDYFWVTEPPPPREMRHP